MNQLNEPGGKESAHAATDPTGSKTTGILLVTSLLIWAAILSYFRFGLVGEGLFVLQFIFLPLALLLGVITNGLLAYNASPPERYAWPVALGGMALWFLTALVMYFFRGQS
jgi:hypothetical protein